MDQVRSFSSVEHNGDAFFQYFSLDFQEANSAFHGSDILTQAGEHQKGLVMDNPAPLCAVVMVSLISFIPLSCTVSQLISLHIYHCMRLNKVPCHRVIIDYLIFLVFVNDALRTIQELYKASSLSSSTVDDVAGSIPNTTNTACCNCHCYNCYYDNYCCYCYYYCYYYCYCWYRVKYGFLLLV